MTHMNWNKFFAGITDDGDHGDEDDTESEDEEICTSKATESTDKNPYFISIGFRKYPCNFLAKRCIKVLFIMLNSALFLAGIAGSVIAIWVFTDHVIMSRLIRPRFFTMMLLLISLIVSIVSLLGLLGLLQNRKKFIKIYIVCYVLFLFTLYICAIFSFWIFEGTVTRIQEDMSFSIENYHTLPSSKQSWDNTQTYLECCGIYSANEWIVYYNEIPKSCCTKPIEECLQMTEAISYESGCLRSAMGLLTSYIHAISIAAVIIFLILLLNLFLALCILARMIMNCPCPD
ncbi:uncharacterized protein LOC105662512 isoform X1 [Megachile rotundata]|uniref:uncharacterized protein LOC105662512 isoform X1 n=1 Tax=Megachile rotundata TaxID=143995 RepID=UPI003FD236E1